MLYRNKKNPDLRFSARTKKHFIVTDEVRDFVDGLLLGDASIQKGSSHATRLTQRFARKFDEWAKQIQRKLKSFGIESTLSYGSTFDKRTKKRYYWVQLQTKFYPEFKIFQRRWYPNGKKEVPNDLRLKPITLENWFLGDGSASRAGPNGARLKLSTDSFSEQSVAKLKEKLEEIGFNFHISNNQLWLYKKSDIERFQSLIKFPICFQYKEVI